MKLIVIAGLPCSGKSKLVEVLRTALQWPILVKDEYKESMFEAMGYSNREWSKRVSQAAYQLMFAQANELVRCGQSFALEGNFRYFDHRERFEHIAASGYEILQVYCYASAVILKQRFEQRARSGQRHPGHVDLESLDEIILELSAATLESMPLSGATIRCDTSGQWQEAIARTARAVIEWSRSTS
jgi:predicted kinase